MRFRRSGNASGSVILALLAVLLLALVVLVVPAAVATGAANKGSSVTGCTVPKLKGNSLTVAKSKIRRSGCRVGKITLQLNAKVTKNHVISQRPVPGRRLYKGARVSLVVSKGVNAAYCTSHPATCYRLSLTFSGGAKGYTYAGQPYNYVLSVKNEGPATVQTPTVLIEPWQITGYYGGCHVSSPVTVIKSASPQPNSVTQAQVEGRTAGQWILGSLASGASKKINFTAIWPSCPVNSRAPLNAWATSSSRPGYTWGSGPYNAVFH